MKAFYALVCCLLICSAAVAQTFEVDTVLKSGPLSERINLVFMGDGYTEAEQAKYITDVTDILDEMFSQTPFKQYKSYFNAFAIKVISEESGANHPRTSPDSDCGPVPQKVVNNYFGSTFDYSNIHRLLYPTQLSKIINVLAANFPLYDQAFVAVNTPYYGGAGGFVATCSDHVNGRDVAMHEIGHSFAGLADEYWAGASYAAEKPNMTKQTDPDLVKWKNWMGTSGVGIYSHSGDASWKKPHTNCKMGVLNALLCKVCTETFVERFHQFVKPLSSYAPEDNSFTIDPEVEQELTFSLSLIPPDPNTLRVAWEKDDLVIAKNVDLVSISSADILSTAIIRATILDTTSLTRSESHAANHIYVTQWEISKSSIVTGTEIETKVNRYDLTVYPNPSQGDLKFSYTLSKPDLVSVSLLDSNGRKIKALIDGHQESGEYSYNVKKEGLNLPSGEYYVSFKFGKTIIPVKVVMN